MRAVVLPAMPGPPLLHPQAVAGGDAAISLVYAQRMSMWGTLGLAIGGAISHQRGAGLAPGVLIGGVLGLGLGYLVTPRAVA